MTTATTDHSTGTPGRRVAQGEQLVLATLIGGVGNHAGAWRRPGSRVEEKYSLSLFRDIVGWAERAKLHAVFLADSVRLDSDTVRSQPFAGLEPLTLLSALSAVTENIGLIGSVSTTFSEPYNVARQLASLDHLSGGRAGWNLVTSAYGEENFGRELPPHDERYERERNRNNIVVVELIVPVLSRPLRMPSLAAARNPRNHDPTAQIPPPFGRVLRGEPEGVQHLRASPPQHQPNSLRPPSDQEDRQDEQEGNPR